MIERAGGGHGDEERDGFEIDGVHVPAGLEVRVRKDDGYRTCSEPVAQPESGPAPCGRDCAPEITSAEGLGVRIAFTCPEHGVHSLVDPFEGRR